MIDIPDDNVADLMAELQGQLAGMRNARRRPVGRSKRGPPPPPTRLEQRTAMRRIVRDFYRRRGWSKATSPGFLASVRRENRWATPRLHYQSPEGLRRAIAMLPELLK